MSHRSLAPVALVSLALVTPALVTTALAESQVLYAECGDGGCTCILSPVTLAEVEALTEIPNPDGAENMVLVRFNAEYIWSDLSPDALDLAMGGDGTCEIGLFQIVPEDGLWKSAVRVQEIAGCLPQVAAMVPPMVDGTGHVKQIAWNGRFHPSKFVVGTPSDGIRWTERTPTLFEGTFPLPPNDMLDVTVTATATLTAPDRAEATMTLRLSAATGTNAGALAMIGMADCRVDAIYDFERIGQP